MLQGAVVAASRSKSIRYTHCSDTDLVGTSPVEAASESTYFVHPDASWIPATVIPSTPAVRRPS